MKKNNNQICLKQKKTINQESKSANKGRNKDLKKTISDVKQLEVKIDQFSNFQ